MALINCTKKEAHAVWNKWKKDNKEIYLFIVESVCDNCNSFDTLHVHHINGDKRNNNADNLQVLCASCHFNIHARFKVKY